MLSALLGVFVLAALAPALHRLLRDAAGWVFAILPAGLFVYFLGLLLELPRTGPVSQNTPWIPSLDISFGFYLDGLSLLYLLLISGIGALICIYSGGYLHGHPQRGRFFASLLFFMGSMLGVVAADNLLLLFIFWELTSISSYLLIGFNHEDKASRASALQALLVTFCGGQAMLVGLILLGWAGGSGSVQGMLESSAAVAASPLYPWIVVLVLIGAFTKSAQTPFHFWLPGAMAAPTPVSAYLHSATMVTAGVFLMARLTPLLGGTDLWFWLVTCAGLATMVTGAVLAVAQTDLKRLLAFTTVSALGTMTLLLGLGSPLAAQAAAAFLLVHSLYKGSMFMLAGAVDHETHTRDVRLLGGLARKMPVTAAAAGMAALAMCGLPPLLGFISKELLYEAKLQFGTGGWVLAGFGVAANALVFAVALIVGFRPFFGRPGAPPKQPHEAPPALWLGPLLLALLGLVFGLFPMLVDKPLVGPAAAAILGAPEDIKLYLWHGWTPMLALSVATVALGVAFYYLRDRFRRWRESGHFFVELGPDRLYQNIVYRFLPWFSAAQTRVIQHGYLRFYVMMVIAAATAAIFIGISRIRIQAEWFVWKPFEWYELLICAAILVSGVAAIVVRGRLSAVALLGIVGYSIALIFAMYGAPDLALTQFLIETLLLILLVLVLYHLPPVERLSRPVERVRDAFICGLVGVAISLMLMKSQALDPAPRLAEYFVEKSLIAQGRNVVNVILVDFRAMDTLGELVVLAVAALGVYSLFRLGARRRGKGDGP